MEELNQISETELLKKANDIKVQHDALKQKIIEKTYEIEENEKFINENAKKLDKLEKQYIDIIEKLLEKDVR